MVPEPHAEQIESFPLEPVRAAPHFRHGIDLRIAARQAALQAQPLVPVERVQMINDFEARLGRIQVHAGNCAQAHKTQGVLQKPRSYFKNPQTLTIFSHAISIVSSPRSNLPLTTALASNASRAAAVACSFKFSGSMRFGYRFRGWPAPDQSKAPFFHM